VTSVERAEVEVRSPVGRVYDYWRTLENLPRFMSNVEEVRPVGPGRTHWVVKGPSGAKMEFDAQTTRDEENSLLAWSATGNGGADDQGGSGGRVRFRELGPERTRVEVTLSLGRRAGGIGAGLVANPRLMLDRDLRDFKRIMEGASSEEAPGAAPSGGQPRPNLGAIALLEEWAADESGYDEEVLPGLKEALDRERSGQRKLFG